MTIKEVEHATGMTKANIRFYEKEGLLDPSRNADNNYRDYAETDIILLKKIKLLRGLGISIAEIQTLIKNPYYLSTIIENRLAAIEQEKQELHETEHVCQQLLKENLDFYSLSEATVDKESHHLKDRIALALTTDMTEKTMTGKQLTNVIGSMLLFSFTASALICNLIIHSTGILSRLQKQAVTLTLLDSRTLYCILAIITAFAIIMTAKPIVHFIMFLLLTLSQPFAILTLLLSASTPVASQTAKDFWPDMKMLNIFFCLAIGYVLLIWLLTRFTDKYLKHQIYAWIVGALFIITSIIIYTPMMDSMMIPIIFFTLFALYISLKWHSLNSDVETCNRYYAVTSSIQMINVFVLLISGSSYGHSWRRGGKEYK